MLPDECGTRLAVRGGTNSRADEGGALCWRAACEKTGEMVRAAASASLAKRSSSPYSMRLSRLSHDQNPCAFAHVHMYMCMCMCM